MLDRIKVNPYRALFYLFAVSLLVCAGLALLPPGSAGTAGFCLPAGPICLALGRLGSSCRGRETQAAERRPILSDRFMAELYSEKHILYISAIFPLVAAGFSLLTRSPWWMPPFFLLFGLVFLV